jgi:hypothetical protein
MNTKAITTALIILCLAAPSAQAGWFKKNKDKPQETTEEAKQRKTAKAGRVGCVVGGILGALALKGKVDGCALGKAAGEQIAQAKQVKEARELAAQINATGMTAQVSTDPTVDQKGQAGEKLKQLSIAYDAKDMAALDAKSVAVLDKLAALGRGSKTQLSFEFQGRKHCEVPERELEQRGALAQHRVIDRCGVTPDNKILVTPVGARS